MCVACVAGGGGRVGERDYYFGVLQESTPEKITWAPDSVERVDIKGLFETANTGLGQGVSQQSGASQFTRGSDNP